MGPESGGMSGYVIAMYWTVWAAWVACAWALNWSPLQAAMSALFMVAMLILGRARERMQ